MEKALADLSTKEFEELVERTIDERLEVWLTQLTDTWSGLEEEDEKLLAEFASSLKRALEQATRGEGTELQAFREQLGR